MSTPATSTQIILTLSRTEREIVCGILSIGIGEVMRRVNRGEKHLDAQLRAARRVLLKLREAK